MNSMMNIDWLHTGSEWVWRNSLHASWLIATLALIRWLGGRSFTPRWQYALGLLVLVRLVLPVELPSRWSVANLLPANRPAAPVTRAVEFSANPPSLLGEPTIGPTTDAEEPVRRTMDWASWLRWTWISGALVTFGIALWRQWRFSVLSKAFRPVTEPRLLRLLDDCRAEMVARRRVELREFDRAVPALIGLRRPYVLLPTNALSQLRESDLRAILLHELAHLKQNDLWMNWLMAAVRALHWFNPLVWLALRRLRADRELVRDEMVLQRLRPDERPLYGHALLNLLTHCSPVHDAPSLATILNQKTEIQRRITMITRYSPSTRFTSALLIGLITPLAILAFTRAAEEAVPSTTPGTGSTNRAANAAIAELQREWASAAERLAQSELKLAEAQKAAEASKRAEREAKGESEANAQILRAIQLRLRQELIDGALPSDAEKVASDASPVSQRIFQLRNSNPVEMVTLITRLFPARNNGNYGSPVRQSVVAVADLRTSSVIVSAPTQLMPWISDVIEQVDSNPREAKAPDLTAPRPAPRSGEPLPGSFTPRVNAPPRYGP